MLSAALGCEAVKPLGPIMAVEAKSLKLALVLKLELVEADPSPLMVVPVTVLEAVLVSLIFAVVDLGLDVLF